VIMKNPRLCIKHFEEVFIQRTSEFNDSEWIRHNSPRDVLVFTNDAIPTLFAGLVLHLSNSAATNIELHNMNVLDSRLQYDIIADFKKP
jgi:hypothetical protein